MITLKYDKTSYDEFLRLKWKNSNNNTHSYRIFRRKVSNTLGGNKINEDFQPIGVASLSNQEESISVLNLHPNCGEFLEFTDYLGETRSIRESEVLQKWIYEESKDSSKGYGLGAISVYSMPISKFNSDPKGLLYNENSVAKYDVVCIGFYETASVTNVKEQFTKPSVEVLSKYIKDGYGVIAGHDVISGYFGIDKNLGPIREFFNVKIGQWDTNDEAGFDYDFKVSVEGSKTRIKKVGPLSYYPWKIGTLDAILDISKTHTTSQFALGNIWYSFIEDKIVGEEYLNKDLKDKANFYLTTHNSTAIIQLGHNIEVTDTERKILVNTIFYVKQRTNGNQHIDYMGIDDENPLSPTIVDHYTEQDTYTATFDYRTEDVGVKLEYYIEGTEISTGKVELSNIIEADFTSDIKHFKYKLNQVASDIPNNPSDNVAFEDWIETKEKIVISEPLKKGYYSFKIVAIDNNLNVSDIKEMIFFMPGIVVTEKSPALTKYPNAQRVNHRYRGPHESKKANDVLVQARYNLNNLKKIVDQLDKEKNVMFERPNGSYTPMIEYKDIIEDRDKNIRLRKEK